MNRTDSDRTDKKILSKYEYACQVIAGDNYCFAVVDQNCSEVAYFTSE